MKRVIAYLCLTVVAVAGVVAVSVSTSANAGYSPVTTTPEGDIVPVEESMHEFMEYVFQPTYLRLKQSMITAPADNKGWKAIKSDALILAESCNLLYVRAPKEHGEDWVKHTTASKEHGAKLYGAAKAKDFEAATAAYKTMLDNCNACHKQFEEGKHILKP